MPHSHMDASTFPMNTVVIYNHKFDVSFSFTPTVRNFDRLHNPPSLLHHVWLDLPFYVQRICNTRPIQAWIWGSCLFRLTPISPLGPSNPWYSRSSFLPLQLCGLVFFFVSNSGYNRSKDGRSPNPLQSIDNWNPFWPMMPFVFIRSENRIPAHPVDIPQPPLSTCQCDLVCNLHITPPGPLGLFLC